MSTERYQFIASGHESVASAFKSIGRAANDSKVQVERSFEGVPRAAARAAGRTVSVEDRAQARRIAILDRADQARRSRIERGAEAELRALEKKLAREQALEEKAASRRAAQQERSARAAAKIAQRDREETTARRWGRANSAISWLGGAAMVGIGAAAAGAGVGLRQSLALDEKSRRIAIQGSSGTNRENPDALRRHFENVAISVPGATAMGVAGGAEKFMAKTGDLEAAKRFSKTWAEVSVATSASIEDIADASADLMQKFDIKKTDDMSQALAVLAEQGKKGAFELKDAAKEYPKIAAAAQRFGIGKGVGALATLGGLTQLARSSTGSAEEAGTSVERMFSNMGVKAGKIKATTGVDVWKGDLKENLVQIVGKMGGKDYGAKYKGLTEVFGERGVRAISPLMQAFADATKDGKDGLQAMRDKIAEATDASGAESHMMRDLADAQQASSSRLTAAWESVKAQLGEQLTPQLVELATRFADFIAQADFGFIATALSNMGEAASNAADFLEQLGFLKKRPKSTEQKVSDAERDVRLHSGERAQLQAKLDKVGPGGLSEEETRRLGVLNDERRLPGKLRADVARQEEDVKTAGTGFMSADEFLGGMNRVGKHSEGRVGMLQRDIGSGAKIDYKSLGLNEEEEALVRRYTSTVQAARGERDLGGRAPDAGEQKLAGRTLEVGSEEANAESRKAAADHKVAAERLTKAADALLDAIKQSKPHFAWPF